MQFIAIQVPSTIKDHNTYDRMSNCVYPDTPFLQNNHQRHLSTGVYNSFPSDEVWLKSLLILWLLENCERLVFASIKCHHFVSDNKGHFNYLFYVHDVLFCVDILPGFMSIFILYHLSCKCFEDPIFKCDILIISSLKHGNVFHALVR